MTTTTTTIPRKRADRRFQVSRDLSRGFTDATRRYWVVDTTTNLPAEDGLTSERYAWEVAGLLERQALQAAQAASVAASPAEDVPVAVDRDHTAAGDDSWFTALCREHDVRPLAPRAYRDVRVDDVLWSGHGSHAVVTGVRLFKRTARISYRWAGGYQDDTMSVAADDVVSLLARVIQAGCETCEARTGHRVTHRGSFSHVAEHGGQDVYAVPCPVDGLTDYWTTEGLI